MCDFSSMGFVNEFDVGGPDTSSYLDIAKINTLNSYIVNSLPRPEAFYYLTASLYLLNNRLQYREVHSMMRELAETFLDVFPGSLIIQQSLWSDLIEAYMRPERVFHSIEYLHYVLQKAIKHCSRPTNLRSESNMSSKNLQYPNTLSSDRYIWDEIFRKIQASLFYSNVTLSTDLGEVPVGKTASSNTFLKSWKEYERFAGTTEEFSSVPAEIIEAILDTERNSVHTPSYNEEPPKTIVSACVCDCELAYLGDSWELFCDYHDFLEEELLPQFNNDKKVFYEHQLKFFTHLLNRDSIYYTDVFYDNYEHVARANLQRAINILKTKTETTETKESKKMYPADVFSDMQELDNLIMTPPAKISRDKYKDCLDSADIALLQDASSVNKPLT